MLDSIALKYYRFLRIPSRISKYISFLYPLYILFIIFINISICIITGNNISIALFVIMIHITSFSFIPLVIKYLAPYMKRRQILNLMIFSTAPGILIEFIGAFFGIYGMLYVALPLIGLLVLRGLTNSRKALVFMYIIPILIELLFAITVDRYSLIKLLIRVSMLTLTIIFSIYLNLVLNSYKKEFNVFELSSAWAKYTLTGIDEDLESQITKLGEERDVKIFSILFHRKNDTIALIVPGVHFGPFKTLGSTLLPQYIEEALNSKGIKTFILHGAGSHELDLVNKAEARKLSINIVDKIHHHINKSKVEAIYEPFRVYNGLHEAFVLQTNSLVLIALSTPIIGGDDIPYEVQRYAEMITPIYGFKDAVIVDCHNSEGLREPDSNKFNPIVVAAISIRKKMCNNFKTGYGEARVYGNVRGLCENKVKVLTMDCDGIKYSLIYLYGNNAKIGVRDSLRRIAMNNGIKDAEVITLDDHSCSGTVFDSPYYAVELGEDIMRTVKNAIKASINDLSDTTVSLVIYNTKANVAGSKIFELLELVKEIGGFVVKHLKLSLIVIHIIFLILVTLLNIFSIQINIL